MNDCETLGDGVKMYHGYKLAIVGATRSCWNYFIKSP